TLNLTRKLSTMIRRLDDSKRFLMTVADCDCLRLGKLVGVALRQGAGWRAITLMVQKSIESICQTRQYTAKDFDIARLIHTIGGRKLGHAMNHALGLPS
ncbi:hypothetical protein BV22DRAFT_975555, partial [Leucogyrophana mollusca]